MYLSPDEAFGFWAAFGRQRRVILALMLHKVRTRFFGHGLGYLIAIAWPLSHIVILVAFFAIRGLMTPYGESTALFIGTGAVPFLTFSYTSRFTALTALMARPLLAFPEVKILDILLASVLVEVLGACLVTLLLVIIAWIFNIDARPMDFVEAAYALGACFLLGAGFGLFNGVIALAFPMWFMVYTLLTIVLWLSSGVIFVPDAMPEPWRSILAYNPILQLIEWTRSAYYEGYGSITLDRRYTLEVGVASVFCGLLFERSMRGYLLSRR
jgi:capsular polysaccharide transport system permease protein